MSSVQTKQLLQQVTEQIDLYFNLRNEDQIVVINRKIQLLLETCDINALDLKTSNFLVNLNGLLNDLGTNSVLIWTIIDLLIKLIENQSIRLLLIDSYNFISPLARFIDNHLIIEKRVKLLELLQDLTCGVKILWQIPHLPHLLTVLSEWIMLDQDVDLITLALGVLVNLCYQNLPVIYTLQGQVDVKKLLRVCTTFEGPIREGHVCRLFVILDYTNQTVPRSLLIKLVDVIFKSINEAYRQSNLLILKQNVEFFMDLTKQYSADNFQIKSNYFQELLMTVKNAIAREQFECLQQIYKFFNCIIQMNVLGNDGFINEILDILLKSIQIDKNVDSLNLLITLTDHGDLQPIRDNLDIFLTIFHSYEIEKTRENTRMLTGIIKLFRKLLKYDEIKTRLSDEIQAEFIEKLYKSITINLTLEEINLFVEIYAFINGMEWFGLQSNLMQEEKIHQIFAMALYRSPPETKCLILQLGRTSTFAHESIAQAMDTVQPSFTVGKSVETIERNAYSELYYPHISIGQIDRIDDVLGRVNLLLKDNPQNVANTDLLELYEMRLAACGNAERIARMGLVTADQRCTDLQCRINQLIGECNHFHQMLFHTQKLLENAQKSNRELNELSKDLDNRLEAEKGRGKMHLNQLKQKDEELEKMHAKCEESEMKLGEAIESKKKLRQLVGKLEENSTKLEMIVQKKDVAIRQTNLTNENLIQEINELKLDLKQKTDEFNVIMKELTTKRKILDTIMDVANSKIS